MQHIISNYFFTLLCKTFVDWKRWLWKLQCDPVCWLSLLFCYNHSTYLSHSVGLPET